MATIRDIARLSGVSQGTVSNVLSGKGNVSSEKIRAVEAAASSLGYAINERARLLRMGRSRIIALILPTIAVRQYADFYLSFKSAAESAGYSVALHLSGDDPETERGIVTAARSGMAAGVVAFASSPRMIDDCREAGFDASDLLFVERDQSAECNYLGFDYARCGREMALNAKASGLGSVVLVSGGADASHDREFRDAFIGTAAEIGLGVSRQLRTDLTRRSRAAMALFDEGIPDGVVCSDFGYAECVRDALATFHRGAVSAIHTVSPLFTLPEDSCVKYELNYRLLGRRAAELFTARSAGTGRGASPAGIGNSAGSHTGPGGTRRVILENSGFRRWDEPVPYAQAASHAAALHEAASPPTGHPRGGRINVLMLDSPEAMATKQLAHLYTQATGVQVNVSVSSYDEIHEILTGMDESSVYDVIRLDVTWLSWFAGRVLVPLADIASSAERLTEGFMPGLSRQYFTVKDKLYALPFSPSAQMLFYRKDLFGSTVLRRLYRELHKADLAPPSTYAEYNRIAAFFTRSLNAHSPVDHGTTVTLGSTGVAGTEFLTRYFSRARELFDARGNLLPDRAAARAALCDLVEAGKYSKERWCPWWTDAAREFSEGNVAMTVLYSNFASGILGRDSRVVNKVGFALVPGGSPVIGGGSLGVSRFSRSPERALSFIRWMCAEPVSTASMLLGGVSACAKSYENYEIIDAYPWLALAGECFAKSRNKRTPYDDFAPFDERRFLGIVGLEVKNAYIGAQSVDEALERISSSYARQFGA